MKMNTLVALILGWAKDRNLIDGSSVEQQYVKLVEEFGEYAAGLARGKLDVQADALGDMMVIDLIIARLGSVPLLQNLAEFTGADMDYDSVCAAIKENITDSGMIGAGKAFRMQAQNVGSLAACISDGDNPEEAVTMVFGACVATCFELGLDPVKVLEDVWNIIKDRKGRMVDGVFIKENDAMMAGGGNQQ